MTLQSMFVLFLLSMTLLGLYLDCKCRRESRSKHKGNHEMEGCREGCKCKKELEDSKKEEKGL